MAAQAEDTKPAIDPTVPLQGVPRSAVKTAEWSDDQEIITSHGFERVIPKRYPKINGIVLNEMTPVSDWRKVLEWFPKVPVMIPESDDEREKRSKTGARYRAAEPIIWNGVTFTMPKGVPVMVPTPIAEMVGHLNEVFRTDEVRRQVEELERQIRDAHVPME